MMWPSKCDDGCDSNLHTVCSVFDKSYEKLR
jgi:hypothetical protein